MYLYVISKAGLRSLRYLKKLEIMPKRILLGNDRTSDKRFDGECKNIFPSYCCEHFGDNPMVVIVGEKHSEVIERRFQEKLIEKLTKRVEQYNISCCYFFQHNTIWKKKMLKK
jgi:hypothetical protein